MMKQLGLFIAFVSLVGSYSGALANKNDIAGKKAVSIPRSYDFEDNQMPQELMIGISDVFVPSGFDSSSEAYVVVSGVFPNGCYRWSKAEVKQVNNTVHEVRSFAVVQPGMCLMVLVPFNKEVRLGVLNSGSHKIRFINGDGTYLEKTLVIE